MFLLTAIRNNLINKFNYCLLTSSSIYSFQHLILGTSFAPASIIMIFSCGSHGKIDLTYLLQVGIRQLLVNQSNHSRCNRSLNGISDMHVAIDEPSIVANSGEQSVNTKNKIFNCYVISVIMRNKGLIGRSITRDVSTAFSKAYLS